MHHRKRGGEFIGGCVRSLPVSDLLQGLGPLAASSSARALVDTTSDETPCSFIEAMARSVLSIAIQLSHIAKLVKMNGKPKRFLA